MKVHLFVKAGAVGLALLFAHATYAQQDPGACPGPATGAFTGCYYNNQTLSGDPTLIRTDAQINFDWGNQSPDHSLQPDNFSARWQGNFPFSAGSYTFKIIVSDGIRFYIDGNIVLDMWQDRAPTFYTVTQQMSSGTHLITVEYYEKSNGATAQLSWTGSSGGGQAAPAISSFTAQPSSTAPNQPVTLAWTVSGANSISIDQGVGDVTGRSNVTLYPAQTTTFVLSASNSAGSTTANATVTIAASGPDTQPPTVPTLLSAVARSANEVDLLWTASADNAGVAGYQIIRNGMIISSVPGAALLYVDNAVAPGSTYTYAVAAYDAAGNVSSPSGSLQVTTPAAQPPVQTSTCPGPATGAFTGCYYPNTTLSGNPVLVRTDNQVNFDWGNTAPDRFLTPLNFSATWQGQFTFTQGAYAFRIITSDGMRVSIDGNLILDQWRDQSPMMYTVTQNISQGVHLVSIQYYERTGGATAQVSWTLTGSTPPPPSQGPVISSFTATPSSASAGQPVSLAWAASGASSLSIDQGVGDVTGRTSVVVAPAATTTYTLTASSASGATATSAVTVNITASGGGTGGGGQTQAPTTPSLVSAIASSASEVDLTWTASTSSNGIGSYQIFRDGYPLASVSGSTLTYADRSVVTSSSYSYMVRAYDPAGNASAPSNSVQVTTPASSGISITWYGPCWYTGTVGGVTGNFQAMDFSLVTPTPVPLQGTLFDGANCTASGGDNMNDYNLLFPTTHMIQGFTHSPNVMPTSAIYWIGDRTPDGRCPPGSTLCSGCVNYNSSTLSCSMMP
jgi:hypothetical protein